MLAALRLAVLACVALLLLLTPHHVDATALTYQVDANEKACFYVWAEKVGQKISFYFAVQSGGSFDIDYSVTDPLAKGIMSGMNERQLDTVFAAEKVGEHSFCFSNSMSTFTSKLVDFEISAQDDRIGVKAELPETGRTTSATGTDHLTPLQDSLYKLSASLSSIVRNQKYFRTRENRNFATVESTESRIFSFSMFESVLIVGMAALQVFVVKTFFQGNSRGRI